MISVRNMKFIYMMKKSTLISVLLAVTGGLMDEKLAAL